MGEKYRVKTFRSGRGVEILHGVGSDQVSNHDFLITGSQSIESIGHPGWQKKLGRFDTGGPFFSMNHEYMDSGCGDIHVLASGGRYEYTGPLFAVSPTTTFGSILRPSDQELHSAGATAIARCEPSNPSFSASTALGELYRDGVPSVIGSGLLKTRLREYRELGGEYLNYQFGWKPFVSDLMSFAQTVKKSDEILTHYRQNNGRKVRARYNFPTTNSTSLTSSTSTAWPGLPIYYWKTGKATGTLTKFIRQEQRRWFEGMFTFHVPDVGSQNQIVASSGHVAEARKLYDCVPTPEAIWNLAPWSWAADWVANTGDIVHNVTSMAMSSLVVRYGYIMNQVINETNYSLNGQVFSGNSTLPDQAVSCNQIYRTIMKMRLGASPFGFGLKFADFSTRQLAILAALGITHS